MGGRGGPRKETARPYPMTYAVLTVCRNAEETIQQTIESVLCQSPPPGRYVFVDGNSGDRTL